MMFLGSSGCLGTSLVKNERGSATLLGGMDSNLCDDFKKDVVGQINRAENTLKHTAGHYVLGQLA